MIGGIQLAYQYLRMGADEGGTTKANLVENRQQEQNQNLPIPSLYDRDVQSPSEAPLSLWEWYKGPCRGDSANVCDSTNFEDWKAFLGDQLWQQYQEYVRLFQSHLTTPSTSSSLPLDTTLYEATRDGTMNATMTTSTGEFSTETIDTGFPWGIAAPIIVAGGFLVIGGVAFLSCWAKKSQRPNDDPESRIGPPDVEQMQSPPEKETPLVKPSAATPNATGESETGEVTGMRKFFVTEQPSPDSNKPPYSDTQLAKDLKSLANRAELNAALNRGFPNNPLSVFESFV